MSEQRGIFSADLWILDTSVVTQPALTGNIRMYPTPTVLALPELFTWQRNIICPLSGE